MIPHSAKAVSLVLLLGLLSAVAAAEPSHARTQVGSNINIAAGEEVTDATCSFCSIHVRGHVAGDITAFGGDVVVEDQGQIDGDITAFGGSIRLEPSAKVGGDLTICAGRLHRDPSASVGGDVTSFAGPVWFVPILAAPFLLLGLLIALVVWIVRRVRRPAVPLTA